MTSQWTRRAVLGAAGAVAATGTLPAGAAATRPVKILGVSCSPRAGKTTAAALRACLEAAAKAGVETELIELAGMKIPVFDPAAADKGDFDKLAPRLADPAVAAIVIGTPVYFAGMSSLCKALLDHWIVFRKNNFALRNKVGAVLAVGGSRNGGQELTLASVQAALMSHEMIIVGDGQPTAHRGATLVNEKDSIAADDYGLGTARNLGARVAEVALRMAR